MSSLFTLYSSYDDAFQDRVWSSAPASRIEFPFSLVVDAFHLMVRYVATKVPTCEIKFGASSLHFLFAARNEPC